MNKKRQGFTLVELMLSLAILGIVLALAYMAFSYMIGTFDRTEKKWIIERDINQVMSQLDNTVSVAMAAEISMGDTLPTLESDEYLFYTDGQNLYYKDFSTEAASTLNEMKVNVTITDIALNDDGTQKVDGEGVPIITGNMVYCSIASDDEYKIPYRLTTGIHLPNVLGSVKNVGGEGVYTIAKFRVARGDQINLRPSDVSGAGCFIATAAYGEYDQSSVMLLRRFRDQVLLTNPLGQKMVNVYYTLSPKMADVIANSEVLRLISRTALQPIIGLAVAVIHPMFALMVSLMVALVIIGVRRRKTLYNKDFYKNSIEF